MDLLAVGQPDDRTLLCSGNQPVVLLHEPVHLGGDGVFQRLSLSGDFVAAAAAASAHYAAPPVKSWATAQDSQIRPTKTAFTAKNLLLLLRAVLAL
jgi:hypothetical protein